MTREQIIIAAAFTDVALGVVGFLLWRHFRAAAKPAPADDWTPSEPMPAIGDTTHPPDWPGPISGATLLIPVTDELKSILAAVMAGMRVGFDSTVFLPESPAKWAPMTLPAGGDCVAWAYTARALLVGHGVPIEALAPGRLHVQRHGWRLGGRRAHRADAVDDAGRLRHGRPHALCPAVAIEGLCVVGRRDPGPRRCVAKGNGLALGESTVKEMGL